MTIAIYIVFGSVVLNIIGRVVTNNNDFAQDLLYCLSITLSLSTSLRSNHPISNLIYLMMIVVGFLLVNLYCLYLGSFLVAEVRSNEFEIAITPEITSFISDIHKEGTIRYNMMNASDYGSHLYNLSTDFGYVINTNLWKNRRFKELFRLLEHESNWYPIPILSMLKKNFIFKKIVNDFNIIAYSSGLWRKWIEEAFTPDGRDINLEVQNDDLLRLSDLILPFIVYSFGMAVGCGAFFVEIVRQPFISSA